MYRSRRPRPLAKISLVTLSGVGLGPVLMPSPASCNRTFIMSMGWMQVVANIPDRPPLTKGSSSRVVGLCKTTAADVDCSDSGVENILLVEEAARDILTRGDALWACSWYDSTCDEGNCDTESAEGGG